MADYIDSLDPLQREAVLADPTPLKVMAGAGSGKTRVIISRIANMVDQGIVKPDKVFASAFTKAAATEMAERVQALVPAEDLLIGTFHSLMFRFINEWRRNNNLHTLGVMKEYDKKRLIQDLLDHPTRNFPDALNVEVDIAEVMGRIGTWKNNLIHHYDPEIQQTIDEVDATIGLGAAARVYAIYEKYKAEQRKVDFDDMLLMAYDLLAEDKEARAFARNKWDAFFIDEAQDTNHAQWEIVKLIAPADANPNLTIVGDTRQCLYRFRGAIPELMDNFNTMYPTARTINLVLNYRSTRQVISSANTLISNFKMPDQTPVRGDGPEAVVIPFEDERDQGEQIASLVTEAKARGYRGGDISVLIRTNAQSVDIERAFVLARHPYWCKGGGFFSHREIADILAYMRLVVNPEDITPLYRIINKPTRYLGRAYVEAVEKNLELCGGNVLDAMEYTDSYGTRKLSKNQRFEVERFTQFMRKLARDKHTSRSMIEAVTDPAPRGLGYLDWLKKTEGLADDVDDHRQENIDALKNAAWEYSDPADLVAFADMTDKLQLESGDAVEICTVHRAKGREWPIVFVSNFYDDSIPHRMAKREGSEADERRIAYVAYTRAQDLLVIGWPQVTMNQGPVQPSPYLAESNFDVPDDPAEWPWWGDAFDKVENKPVVLEKES